MPRIPSQPPAPSVTRRHLELLAQEDDRPAFEPDADGRRPPARLDE